MEVPTSPIKASQPVAVVVDVIPPLFLTVVVVPILIPTEAGGVEETIPIINQIGLFAKCAKNRVILPCNVIIVLITPTLLKALHQCKHFLPLLNRLLITIGIQILVPLIMLLMILPI